MCDDSHTFGPDVSNSSAWLQIVRDLRERSRTKRPAEIESAAVGLQLHTTDAAGAIVGRNARIAKARDLETDQGVFGVAPEDALSSFAFVNSARHEGIGRGRTLLTSVPCRVAVILSPAFARSPASVVLVAQEAPTTI